MASMTFDLVQRLVDRLTTAEQAQLLAYLAPKLAGAVAAQEAPPPAKGTTWDDFFAAGDALQDDAADQSMTAAVIAMRR
jgi:hypothetical protein